MILVGGGVLLVGLLIALINVVAAANPGGAAPTGTLVASGAADDDRDRPPGLAAWEALLLSGATSGRRGRERLARRMREPVATLLADHHGLALGDPRAAELLGPEWAFLEGGPPPPGVGTDEAGIVAAVDAVLDRLGAPPRRDGRAG